MNPFWRVPPLWLFVLRRISDWSLVIEQRPGRECRSEA